MATGPPPPSVLSGSLPGGSTHLASLPPGWSTAMAQDGRIYYWDQSTGTTSWTHPLAQKPPPPPVDQHISPSMSSKSGILAARSMKSQPSMNEFDTPINASRRPDSHQCYAVVAVILFFPLGLCALIQSFSVDQAWDHAHYGDAVNHSRQALLYARISCAMGAIFWIYWIFFSGPGGFVFDWPRFA
jgi:WW domain/Interferon-induced transmembrane protein